MAHIAVTDTEVGRFLAEQQITRVALGLAGARDEAFDVWVKNWSARQARPGSPIELVAGTSEAGIELILEPRKPIVLNGIAGLDRKGAEPGNASYYYSIPRLDVSGQITLSDEGPIAVDGLAWLDREWGTGSLSDGIEGWDWFALQLSDGRDLMYYRLRTAEGTTRPFSAGTLVDSSGGSTHLEADAALLEAAEWWTSEVSGVRYPVGWRLSVPDADLQLVVAAVIPNQALNLAVRYWEGAVEVSGAAAGAPISGRGYLELAGYGRDP